MVDGKRKSRRLTSSERDGGGKKERKNGRHQHGKMAFLPDQLGDAFSSVDMLIFVSTDLYHHRYTLLYLKYRNSERETEMESQAGVSLSRHEDGGPANTIAPTAAHDDLYECSMSSRRCFTPG